MFVIHVVFMLQVTKVKMKHIWMHVISLSQVHNFTCTFREWRPMYMYSKCMCPTKLNSI